MIPTPFASKLESAGRPWRDLQGYFSKRGGKVSAWVLALIFIFYRLASFTPQPLDGPHTLRPVLNAWFDAFIRCYEHPETAYEDWRAMSLLLLMAAPSLAVIHFIREHRPLNLPARAARIIFSRGLFFTAIATTLLVCRFPTLVDYQLNPDEGEFLSAAHKLFYNANYFDSVDCGTSGPLNIYPLMLPAVLGLSPDYASSRVLVLLVAFFSIYLFYRAVRLLVSDAIARLAILPLACALAVFEHSNLIHYSSEQIPILLISLAFYIAVRLLHDPAHYGVALFLLGFLASAAFFSKMQSVPVVVFAGAIALLYTYTVGARTRWGPLALFIGGLLPLQILNAAMCLSAGAWSNFWISYITSNQRYAGAGSGFIAELPGLLTYFFQTPETGYFLFTLLALAVSFAVLRFKSSRTDERSTLLQTAMVSGVVIGGLMAALLHADVSAIAVYVVLLAIFSTLAIFLLLSGENSFGTDPVRWFGLLASGMLAAAVFSIYRAHRLFPHYLFFLFVPISAVMAWMLIRQVQEPPGPAPADHRGCARLAFPLLFAALALTQATFLWGSRDPHNFRTTVVTIRQPEGDLIRSLTSPGGQIFVWGWTPDPYLGSGHVTATRDLNVAYQFNAPEEITSYYRQRLLNDLSHNPPELIVDAIGTDSWALEDQGTYGLDKVPQISGFVRDFYRHVVDAYGERFFLRADLVARAASIKLPKACAPAALRCIQSPRRFYGDGMTTPIMDNQPPLQMPQHALLEVQFTPFGRQTDNATVVNSEAVPNGLRGFRFQNMGGDLYRLLVGLGNQWAFSNPILLPEGKPVWLSIEFSGVEVRLKVNGALVDTMRMPAAMADSPGPVTIGSWLNGECRFSGTIQFFQIEDLGKVSPDLQ